MSFGLIERLSVFFRGCEVSGVLGAHTARPEDGVRRGHPGRTLPSSCQEEGEEMLLALEPSGKIAAIQTVFLREEVRNETMLSFLTSSIVISSTTLYLHKTFINRCREIFIPDPCPLDKHMLLDDLRPLTNGY